tara:strand:- start:27978 stop:28226 length:249 start_codon:yes stop_codon:yes gene_type:complete
MLVIQVFNLFQPRKTISYSFHMKKKGAGHIHIAMHTRETASLEHASHHVRLIPEIKLPKSVRHTVVTVFIAVFCLYEVFLSS